MILLITSLRINKTNIPSPDLFVRLSQRNAVLSYEQDANVFVSLMLTLTEEIKLE